MNVLVTGAAGFIGYHTVSALLRRGDAVLGIDHFSDYYSPRLKRDRVAELEKLGSPDFHMKTLDLADCDALYSAADAFSPDGIIHLAAQPGVRYSLENPQAYIRENIQASLNVLETARHISGIGNLVIASSSSVYGANDTIPFSVNDRVDRPISLYAATKKSVEMMAHAYHHLFGIPVTLLRFFTVYGPWGRPDMAPVIFGKKILDGEPIRIFGDGTAKRDFTYIDDIVAGVLAALDTPQPFKTYNLGNDSPVELNTFIDILERRLDRKAVREYGEKQPGDVDATWADIELTRAELGYDPKIALDEGLARFAEWLIGYHTKL